MHRMFLVISACWFVVSAPGCGVHIEPLMPTPALYLESGTSPLRDVPTSDRWTPRRVYYATTRARDPDLQRIEYSNRVSDRVSLGLALVEFGDLDTRWDELDTLSRVGERERTLPLTIGGVVEGSRVRPSDAFDQNNDADETGWLQRQLADSVGRSSSGDVLVFVHGAKVNFYNACAFTAQLDHFTGRRMTSVAFSWPTRQDLFSYGVGGDVRRAYDAAPALAMLLRLLSEHTPANRIHVVCWSAGARVTSRALGLLRERNASLAGEALRDRLRIGTVYFAAGDVPRDEFLESLPAIHEASDRVVVSVSSRDGALLNANRFMGGGTRLGQTGGVLSEQDRRTIEAMERVEVVNVSLGREVRGFDITGHRYWFNHPWASSDLVLAIGHGLAAARRGLEPTASPAVWALPPDYPQRLRTVADGLWGGP